MRTTASGTASKPVAPNASKPRVQRRATLAGSTGLLCAGLILAYLTLPDGSATEVFRWSAIVVGVALSGALLLEARGGARSLVRTDLLMLLALYGLTFFEFLFPQPGVDRVLSAELARAGTTACLIGFAGLALGRHFMSRRSTPAVMTRAVHLSAGTLGFIFWAAFVIGYFHMFWAVGFNPVELISEMLEPRFSRSWGRGRLGGWAELLNELGLLIYLIPPLAGIVLARRKDYRSSLTGPIALGFLFTLFYGFTTGTRNVFAVYVITFLVSYLACLPSLTLRRTVILSAVGGGILLAATHYMLEFRQTGLQSYVHAETPQSAVPEGTIFVDHNLVTISRLTEVFPEYEDYLGLEIPYQALIRPIPRALWSGKPEGLSISIENALGARGYTLAATFVGEAYVAGGYLAVVFASLAFGALAAWWNRLGQHARSNFDILLYASGFFAAALAMRSMLWVSVAMLPTLALWFYAKWLIPKRRATRNQPSI